MQNAAEATYPLLEALVVKAAFRVGSRMAAYGDVARGIGASGSWVRKFLGRQPVRLDADTYLKIKAEYERECARWEAEADKQKARFFALGREGDAMAEAEARTGSHASASDDCQAQSRDLEGCRGLPGDAAADPAVARLVVEAR